MIYQHPLAYLLGLEGACAALTTPDPPAVLLGDLALSFAS